MKHYSVFFFLLIMMIEVLPQRKKINPFVRLREINGNFIICFFFEIGQQMSLLQRQAAN